MTAPETRDQPNDAAPVDLPPGPPASSRAGFGFAAFMVIAGMMHFVVPSFYERIVPAWAGDAKRVVWWSGWAEIACGTLVAMPKSRRFGAWVSLVLLIVVYPA